MIVGLGGGDTLSSGTGATAFVYTATADLQPGAGNYDTITGFRSGVDTLDFAFSNPPNLLFALEPCGVRPDHLAHQRGGDQ